MLRRRARIMTGPPRRPAVPRASLSATLRIAASQPSASPRSARRCRSTSARASTAVSMFSSLASKASGETPARGRGSGPAARWQMKREIGMPAASARSRMRRHSVSVAVRVLGYRMVSVASSIVRSIAMKNFRIAIICESKTA